MSTISEKLSIHSSPVIEVNDHSPSLDTPPYSVFSIRQRITIILMVSSVSILSSLSSALYTPALPKMAATLGVSISAVNFTITTYLVLQGLSPLFSGAIGDSLGRRMLYSATLTIYIGACVGLSITNAYPVVLVLCGLLAAGAAPNTALGAGVIGDLVPASQRGGYMGLYNAGIGLGDAIGPVLGGTFAQFTGYHGIFIFLLAVSAFLLLLIVAILPETLHFIVGNGSILPVWYLRPFVHWLLPSGVSIAGDPTSLLPARKLDVFGPIRLLRQPDVLCCLAFTGICYMVWQMSMVATSAQYSTQYHLNEFLIGLTYISNGIGELVGSLLMGKILDHEYRKQLRREAAGGMTSAKNVVFIGRARLNALLFPIPMFIACIIAFGWVIKVHTHIAVPVVLAFLIGWSVQSILTALATLLVDLFEDQSSTATATFIMIKGLMGAVGSSSIQPLINAIGTGWTFTAMGGLCILALSSIVLEFRYGGTWRARRTQQLDHDLPLPEKDILEYRPSILTAKAVQDCDFPEAEAPAAFPADFSPEVGLSQHQYGYTGDTVAGKKIVAGLSKEYRYAPLSVVLLSALYVTIFRMTGQEGGSLGFRHNGEDQVRNMKVTLDPKISAKELIQTIMEMIPDSHFYVQSSKSSTSYQVVLFMVESFTKKPISPLAFGCEWQIMYDSRGIKTRIHFSEDIFESKSIDLFAAIFSHVLEAFVSSPSMRLDQLPLYTPVDLAAVKKWNRTTRKAVFQGDSVGELFRQTAGQQNSNVAVINSDGSMPLTFEQLDKWSDALAQWLISKGYGDEKETIIGVWQTRSTLFVVSLLACHKAGCAYMPIEMTLPKERIRYMLSDTACPMVLINGYADDFPCTDIVDYVDLASNEMQNLLQVDAVPKHFPFPAVTSDRLSHVIFTSGSTGLPKAVMIQHSCLLNFVNSEYKPISNKDRTAVMLNIAFDVSSGEIWYPLIHGATLVCYVHTPSSPVDILNMSSFLNRERITSFAVSTAVFKLLVEAEFFERSLPLLQSVDLVGEAAYLEFIRPVLLARPDLAVYNCYGPSESTIYATTFQVPPDYRRTHIAIGKPMANIGAYIVDQALQPVPQGVCGELLLTGNSLARGYLNRPDLTGDKFIELEESHPFGPNRAYHTGDIVRWTAEDELVFLYRKEDGQVKLRGQRLELGEIEQTLKRHPDVVSAAAALVKMENNDHVVAYIVLNPSENDADEQVLGLWDSHFNNEESTYHSLHTEGGRKVVRWYSMFDGKPIPSIEMVEWLDDTVNQIAPTKADRVLEVGVGSGMVALQVAPQVRSYVGTDLSTPSLESLQAHLEGSELSSTVSLLTASAHELDSTLTGQHFSLIILNSVLQYFPSADYLAQVIAKMVELIDPEGGRIVIGDVRSYCLISLHDLERSLATFQDDQVISAELQASLTRYAEGQTELLVDPAFFLDIERRLSKVVHVEIKPKLMSTQNELSRYRYNVVLHVNRQPRLSKASTWFDCSSEDPKGVVDYLRDQLRSTKEDTVGALHVPSGSLQRIQEILDESLNPTFKRKVKDIRQFVTDDAISQFSTPRTIMQMAEQEGWRVGFDYTLQHGSRPSFRAIFERKRGTAAQTASLDPVVGDFPDVSLHGPSYNSPSNAASTHSTNLSKKVASIKEFLKERLPAYMVPSRIISVDELPLTRSGKIDRKTLASLEFLEQHDSDSREMMHAVEGPSTANQREVLALFSRALNRSPETIDIRESLFALGGHSLMATLVVNAIRRELGVNLSMSEFYREPTVKAIASLVTTGKKGRTTSSTTSFYDGVAGVPSTTIMANEDGPAPTIFMFPEVTGFASVYATAFENIQHRVVVFGDENWGKPFEERESIQDLARGYLQKVRAIQQSGPYHLAGWSFGGYLAFEVARQMQEAGEDVAILMMFDSYVYHEPLRMVEWTDDLHHLLQVNDDKPAWIAQFNRVRTLISKYEGPKESYRGKAVLVKALRIAKEDAEDYPHPENPYNGWREYVPRIERRSIEATHRTMFSLQNGQKMGKMISEIMMSI